MSPLTAERAVLGAMLLGAADLVVGNLTADDFSRESHAKAFSVMEQMFLAGDAIDPVTVKDRLGDDAVALVGYMSECATPSNAAEYAKSVKRESRKRRLARVGAEIVGLSEIEDVDEAEAKALDLLQDRTVSHHAERLRDIAVDRITTSHDKRDYLTIPGFPGVHVYPGNLIVVGAYEKDGKTTSGTQWLWGWAKMGVRCCIYSYEMSRDQTGARAVTTATGISQVKQDDGLGDAKDSLADQVKAAVPSELFYHNAAGWSPPELLASLRRFASSGGRIALVDYLQLAAEDGTDVRIAVSRLTRSLKLLANQMGLIIILPSQFKRPYAGTTRLPTVHDFRESGSIEQDADICMLLYLYNGQREGDPEAAKWEESDLTWIRSNFVAEVDGPIARLTIAANRNGKTFTWPCTFDEGHLRFVPMERR